MSQALWAEQTARRYLEVQLPTRWAHTQRVAAQSRTLAPILGGDADRLEAAAWLHDIGYSPDLMVTGFHPLDGARYLRSCDADDILCRLVAYHSCAIIEASERGLAADLTSEFSRPRRDLEEALIYCDMTSDPHGTITTVEERLAEILVRYSPCHPVNRAIRRASPGLIDAMHVVQARLASTRTRRLADAIC